MRVDWRGAMLVAEREYLENIRTRGFWISLLLLPVILLVASSIPVWLTQSEAAAPFGVVDRSGWVEPLVHAQILEADVANFLDALRVVDDRTLSAALLALRDEAALGDARAVGDIAGETAAFLIKLEEETVASNVATTIPERLAKLWREDPASIHDVASDLSSAHFSRVDVTGLDRAALNARLADETIVGYFVIPQDPITSASGAEYVSKKLTNPELRLWYERWVTEVVRERRIRQENLSPAIADWISSEVRFSPVRVTEEGAETAVRLEDTLAQWAPVAFVYLLWVSIFAVTQMLLTNTVEEKSNRLVEVLLSSLAAIDLMAGKILGIAATGLTIVLTWLVIFLAVVIGLPHWLGAAGGIDLTALVDNPLYLGSFFVYFVLGYLFYAALLCALGSLASNLKEAQTLMLPVQVCLLIPLLVMIPIGRDPSGWLAVILSWIPPLTPFVMMNRAAFPPGIVTYLGTTFLLVASIYLALRAAARIFETGILMTGKRPRLSHLVALLRRRPRVSD